jgi:hypothetical protein
MAKDHYLAKSYITRNRWFSFWYQLSEIMSLPVKSILEIGPGNKIVYDILKKMGYDIKTYDNDPELNPDYLGDINQIDKAKIAECDIVVAFQMFEHIPYKDFLESLIKLKKISRKYLYVSLPYTNKNSRFFSLNILSYPLPSINFSFIRKYISKKIDWIFNGIHYWELGTKQNSIETLELDLNERGWIIKKKFMAPENPYHYFFLCEKKQ